MTNNDINKNSYDMIAKNYSEEHGKVLAWKNELDKFIMLLDNPNKVIDLGCGHGDETIYLSSHLPSSEVIGVDFSSQMIKLAKLKPSNVKFVHGDIVEYNPKELVNGIWARASLHHLSDKDIERLFSNIGKYAQKDLVICMVNKYGHSEELEEKQKYGQLLQRYFNYFDELKVYQLAEKHNYTITDQYIKQEDEHKFLVSYLQINSGK